MTATANSSLFAGIYRMYEARSGEERSKGIPTVVTLAMGMQESRQGCGWDNNYQKDVYNACVFDYGKMQGAIAMASTIPARQPAFPFFS